MDQLDRLLDAHDLLRWCQGLITYDPRTSIITLSHSSVRTYLLSDQIKESPTSPFSIDELMAKRLLFRKCLTYMLFTDFAKGYCSSRHKWKVFSGQWPLLSYASQHWASHAHTLDAELEPYDQEMISKFCSTSNGERSGNFGFWVQCLCPEADIEVFQDTQPLYYAASYGLREVVRSLITINKDMDLDALGGRNASSALHVACYRGNYRVAKDLLDAGANPFWKDGCGRSALFYAVFHGDTDIAELLRQSLRAKKIDATGETASIHIRKASSAAGAFLAARDAGEKRL